MARFHSFLRLGNFSAVRNLPASVEDVGLSPGSGESPREENVNPLQYYCLGNPMDRGAWWATVHRVTQSQTPLSNKTRT